MPYIVRVKDKRNKNIRTVYVRASSPENAIKTGVRTAREVFGNRKAVAGNATRDGWDENTELSNGRGKVEFY